MSDRRLLGRSVPLEDEHRLGAFEARALAQVLEDVALQVILTAYAGEEDKVPATGDELDRDDLPSSAG